MKKLKVAVTGGIGSGKSCLCSFYSSLGYPVLSSDAVAKEIMVQNAGVKKQIKKHFGEESYNDGNIDKEYLAKKVFSDPEKTSLINSIVHPAAIKEMELRIKSEFIAKDIVFVESALVYEAEIEKNFDFVILVLSDDKEKITRVTKRDNVKAGAVIARINSQIPDEEKKDMVDFVIKNDSTLEELKKRGEFILKILEGISKGD